MAIASCKKSDFLEVIGNETRKCWQYPIISMQLMAIPSIFINVKSWIYWQYPTINPSKLE
jgi:hypothetical protein